VNKRKQKSFKENKQSKKESNKQEAELKKAITKKDPNGNNKKIDDDISQNELHQNNLENKKVDAVEHNTENLDENLFIDNYKKKKQVINNDNIIQNLDTLSDPSNIENKSNMIILNNNETPEKYIDDEEIIATNKPNFSKTPK